MNSYSLGLTRYPLEHSLSPLLHRAALQAAGLAGEYRLYPVPPLPAGAEQLDDLLSLLRRGEIHGLNVTIPHKQAVLQRVDALSPVAQATGAVNTAYVQGGGLLGENTDAAGFYTALQSFWRTAYSRNLPNSNVTLHALVLGAGGSARAVVYALVQAGWHVTLAARRFEQASQVISDLRPLTSSQQELAAAELSAAGLSDRLSTIDLLVNTTPVGMWPAVDATPWPAGLALPDNSAVYDLVYNPSQTALLRAAHISGLPTANGLDMLVEQAALAFECWAGQPASRSAMRQSLAGFLEGGAP